MRTVEVESRPSCHGVAVLHRDKKAWLQKTEGPSRPSANAQLRVSIDLSLEPSLSLDKIKAKGKKKKSNTKAKKQKSCWKNNR